LWKAANKESAATLLRRRWILIGNTPRRFRDLHCNEIHKDKGKKQERAEKRSQAVDGGSRSHVKITA